jgi:hypothetical protein
VLSCLAALPVCLQTRARLRTTACSCQQLSGRPAGPPGNQDLHSSSSSSSIVMVECWTIIKECQVRAATALTCGGSMPQPLQTLHPWQGRYLAYIVCSAGQSLQPAYNAPGLLWRRCQIMLSCTNLRMATRPMPSPPPHTHLRALATATVSTSPQHTLLTCADRCKSQHACSQSPHPQRT